MDVRIKAGGVGLATIFAAVLATVTVQPAAASTSGQAGAVSVSGSTYAGSQPFSAAAGGGLCCYEMSTASTWLWPSGWNGPDQAARATTAGWTYPDLAV